MTRARVRPLRIRPGARYQCRGDGLSCGDVHLWGPLTPREASSLRLISPDVITRRPEDGLLVLQARTDGRCLFWNDGCTLHRALGPRGKPATCRRFPFSITATPRGGRVVVSNRCSCVLMPSGDGIDPAEVVESLSDGAGRLRAAARVDHDVILDRGRAVTFARWEELETELLSRLAREEPEAVIDREPFPRFARGALVTLGEALIADGAESRADHALTWFGDTLLAHLDGREPPPRERPWADAFDAAERAVPERPARELLADWVAADVWGLAWTDGGSFALARQVLALRIAVARALCTRLEALALRPDRAAAEAILAVSLTGVSTPWSKVVQTLRDPAASR
jgi:hypothetical protein